LQAVHRTDLCKQRLIDMTRHKQLVDQPGIIHQALPDQILQQRIADNRVLNTGLHGLCQRRPLILSLAQKFLLKPLGCKENIERRQDEQQQTRCKEVTR